ncbi:MAG TPA: diaminopimelate epimerase [Acidimicrobiaceae bacterium]|nr:diaminopimelate epimerase [Acidimicrobiaceae bacterium]
MRLTKHHGLGNDFLVYLTDEEPTEVSALARRICDRRTGIGADGLIVGLPGINGSDLVMVLHNADGSFAEMSGNGIRCLAQAHAMANQTGAASFEIDTGGGRRHVEIDGDGPEAQITVSMGLVGAGPGVHDEIANEVGHSMSATADLGNPHLVLVVEDCSTVDMSDLGSRYEAFYPDGINVEVISLSRGESDKLDMVVWERGVGVSQACGTGAIAAAVRANQWNLVRDDVHVQMPGGSVRVLVGEEPILVGPAEYVGAIEVSV